MPEEVTPETGNTTDAVDWESDANPYVQRYRDVQSTLTPVQQENARLRALETDRDAYIALGEKHGFEFDLGDATQQSQGEQESAAELAGRLAAVETWKSEFEAKHVEQDQKTQWGHWDTHVEGLARDAGLKLTDHEKTWLMVNTSAENGYPKSPDDTVAAFTSLAEAKQADREALEAEIRESMKRPRVPHTPGGGEADTGIPDYSQMSRADIDKAMAERAMGAL